MQRRWRRAGRAEGVVVVAVRELVQHGVVHVARLFWATLLVAFVAAEGFVVT